MQWLCHDHHLFAAVRFLRVGCPCVEDVSSVWEEIAIVISLGEFQNLEELVGDLRFSRDTFVCWASKDEEYVLAFFNYYLFLFIAVTTASCHFGKRVFIEGLSAAIKNSYDVAVF